MKKLANKKGFTLVELLVVVAIIGILASIAIPQFSAYRERAHNGAANSDLRSIMTSQETYFVDNNEYANAITNGATALAKWVGPANTGIPFNISANVEANTTGDASTYSAATCSTSGSDKVFRYRLDDGLGIDDVNVACVAGTAPTVR